MRPSPRIEKLFDKEPFALECAKDLHPIGYGVMPDRHRFGMSHRFVFDPNRPFCVTIGTRTDTKIF